ncbi:MAG: hypothetical protein ABGY71_12910 [bacterium]|nr:hypothetical protein [Planctomycetota bacterium]HIL52108.1 hypothetical protein [Planctomycetota bacterium]
MPTNTRVFPLVGLLWPSLPATAGVVCVCALLSSSARAQTLPDNIDISASPNGIVVLPTSVSPVFRNVFDRYTKVVAPNGQAIHFLLQSQVTDEMAVRAREVLRFYITDVPGTQYGANKTALANQMGNLEAALVYFNTEQAASQAFNGPLGNANIFAQDLYATESVLEGSGQYLNNTVRDATLEEVFHLVHGAGLQPTLPAFHEEILQATNAAIAAGMYNPPPPSELPPADRPFEYIISIIDVYYGFWAHNPDGNGTSFGGEYAFHTRAALEAGDLAGVTAMLKFLPANFSADLSAAASFNGTFSFEFDSSTPYTHKSQYLTRMTLSGQSSSHLRGNSFDNTLAGNSGNNTLNGGAGSDTAVFRGPRAEYTLLGSLVSDSVAGRDGSDTLVDMEWLKFSDQTIPAGGAGSILNYCTSRVNSSGAPAIVFSGSHPSAGANDLALLALPVPANQPGIFFYGPNQVQLPFGNGTRCIGAPITRLGVTFASPFGDMQVTIDNQAAPISGAFTPGSVWNFQAWFRDPVAGGANFDLSDGLEVTFGP